MAKKKNDKDKGIEDISSTEEEIEFTDTPNISGKKIADFCFDTDTKISSNENAVIKSNKTFKRSYMLTKGTIRKVDELKAKHPSVTTYVSTIVEDAINHYYDYVMNTKEYKK